MLHTFPYTLCAGTKTIPDGDSTRSCAAPRRYLKCYVIYRIGVHTIPNSICAGTKTILDGDSVRSRDAPISKVGVTYRLGVHTI